ncbi:hypothetical protein E2C01_028865 [Portunus trituberculatus]|uniref:Uncharacterized protein n=1 Tax=Portunus trituberculatus TaxID=210409 RepID=A0A5B7ER76_PORTR|nr:hypothetical protein [Portunus trituberculatus]
MHLPHTHPSLETQTSNWRLQIRPQSLLGRPEMSPGRTLLSMATKNVLIPPSTFSSLTSATFATLDLIFNLWNTTSPLLNLIFFSSPKHSCLRQSTVAPFLFPPSFSTLIFAPKLDVASMCATTQLALVPALLNLLSSPPSFLHSIIILYLNLAVLSISPLTPLTIVNSLTI